MAEFRKPEHKDPTHLLWSPDGTLLAVSDRYSDTVIYNIDSADDTLFISREDTKFVFSMAFHPTVNHIALAHGRGVNIYDVASTKLLWKVETPHYTPSNIAYAQDGNLLFVACWHEDEDPYGINGALFVYDTTTRKQVHKHINTQALAVKIAVDHDNQQFAWSGNDGIVRLCDMRTFKQIATFEPFKVNSPAVTFMKFLGQDALYIECEDDYEGKICLWQPTKNQSHDLKQITELKNHRDQFYQQPLTIVCYGNHPYRYQVRDVHAPDEILYACRGNQGGGANIFSYLAVHAPSKLTAWADASYQSYEKVPRNRLSIYDWEKHKIIIQFGENWIDSAN